MTEFLSAHRFLANLNGTWTDLTDYVVEDISGHDGLSGNGPLDLLADTGVMRIVLNNMSLQFDPDSAAPLTGWKKGIQVKLEMDYEGDIYTYLGTIGDIDPERDEATWAERAIVTVNDWLEYSARHPLINPGILINQTGDDVITTLLGLMPIPPQATDLAPGVSIFPTTFDTVTSKTKAYTELTKVAFSEPGFVYLRKDRVYGETLVFESNQSRYGWKPLDDVPLGNSDSGFLLKEDGGYLLKEDGGKLILNQVGTLQIDNAMLDIKSNYGKQLINYFTVTANPRRLDTSPQVLFQLDEPIPIASGQTIIIKGTYADPAGGLPINGQDMIDPVVDTDYKVWTNSDGSGTDLTSSLTLLSIVYGTEGFTHHVRNDSNNAGYVTKYSPRGYGIYLYNPIEHAASDTDSIDEYGYQTENMDQKYQADLAQGSLYVEKAVEFYRNPHNVVEKITFLANAAPSLMMAFLNFGPGNLFHMIDDRRNIDNYFFIQGRPDWKITDGGMIMCTWLVKLFECLSKGLSEIAIEFGGGSATDGVNFGNLPAILNLTQRSYSFWLYVNAAPVSTSDNILAPFDDDKGILISITTDLQIQYYSKRTSTLGIWKTPISSVTTGTWVHVVVTMDQVDVNSDPVIYIDGSSQTLTEASTPGGTLKDENSLDFIIGNWLTATNNYTRALDGKVKDVRVYNRILSSSEVNELYNSGTPDETLVTNGLVFQAFCVRTKDLSSYEDQALTDALKVLDNMFGAVGTPHGSPIGRSF